MECPSVLCIQYSNSENIVGRALSCYTKNMTSKLFVMFLVLFLYILRATGACVRGILYDNRRMSYCYGGSGASDKAL